MNLKFLDSLLTLIYHAFKRIDKGIRGFGIRDYTFSPLFTAISIVIQNSLQNSKRLAVQMNHRLTL